MYHLHASKTTLAASVGHSCELGSAGLGYSWFEPQGPVVVWVGGGRQSQERLGLGRLLNPSLVQAVVGVVVKLYCG